MIVVSAVWVDILNLCCSSTTRTTKIRVSNIQCLAAGELSRYDSELSSALNWKPVDKYWQSSLVLQW